MEPIALTEDIDLLNEDIVWEEKTTEYKISVQGTVHTIRIRENSNGTELIKFSSGRWVPLNEDNKIDNLIHGAYVDGAFY